jgi:hypothetical protein
MCAYACAPVPYTHAHRRATERYGKSGNSRNSAADHLQGAGAAAAEAQALVTESKGRVMPESNGRVTESKGRVRENRLSTANKAK